MPRVFLDSNVWFSAFYGSKNCEVIMTAAKNRKIKAVISKQVLEEITRNIKEKLPEQLDNLRNFLLDNPPEIVRDPKSIPKKISGLVSNEDSPIFTAAIFSSVDNFITGNIKDFKIKELEKITGIIILTPAEAVKTLNLT